MMNFLLLNLARHDLETTRRYSHERYRQTQALAFQLTVCLELFQREADLQK
ncbi:hypothetical protein [Nitrosomonas nitrosa]|uniref:hypothetical protein n=1 Tax=Nitrosomonas nitrosa TaxID=52442 RepID=UPI0015A60E97|nr:hypothetical protein [Nitrosomonas nitrosa]